MSSFTYSTITFSKARQRISGNINFKCFETVAINFIFAKNKLMKTILLIFFALLTLTVAGQGTTRIRQLITEPTYNGTISIPCDRSTYSVHHKIFLSTISDYVNGLSLTRDTAIWDRLTSLESNTVWEAGSGTRSIQAVNSQDTATANYSLAHGFQTHANIRGARSYSSGSTTRSTDGWSQCLEFTMYGSYVKGSRDSLLVGGVDSVFIPNNFAILTTVSIIGVGTSGGADLGLTYSGTFQFVIKNIAGTTSKTATDTLAINVEAGVTAAVLFAADDTNEALIIDVTSTNDSDMYWKAEVKMVAIKFD
jgi:hypothetical protein